jgi:hypothetical protein
MLIPIYTIRCDYWYHEGFRCEEHFYGDDDKAMSVIRAVNQGWKEAPPYSHYCPEHAKERGIE